MLFAIDHRTCKAGLPVRSVILKPCAGRLVVGWVTTSEYLLLIVLSFLPPENAKSRCKNHRESFLGTTQDSPKHIEWYKREKTHTIVFRLIGSTKLLMIWANVCALTCALLMLLGSLFMHSSQLLHTVSSAGSRLLPPHLLST